MANRRKRQPGAWTFIETTATGGAAIGVLLQVNAQLHRHVSSRPCASGRKPGDCLGTALNKTITPYVVGAFVGLVIAGSVAIVAILVWRSFSSRIFSFRATGPQAVTAGGAQPRLAAPSVKPQREPISERVRHEVWRRDQGAWVDCTSRERLEFDHIIPVSRGGSNTARNIELRCQTCNRRKGQRV